MTQSFDTAMQPMKVKPVVPEVASYGFILVALCLVVLAIRGMRQTR